MAKPFWRHQDTVEIFTAMTHKAKSIFLQSNTVLYNALIRRLLFLMSAQTAHRRAMQVLKLCDSSPVLHTLLQMIHRAAFDKRDVSVGGCNLAHPLILAAGFVKGEGFETEAEALAAVERGKNIIPGWRSMPALVGLVEFGSFTRWPRMGNPGNVLWRDRATLSIQNRVGLRNPGATAAAAFLARHRHALPDQFGINIAVSPGVNDPDREQTEVLEALSAFLTHKIFPSWFTLNLSCPNTEDDPGGHQTQEKARGLCRAVNEFLSANAPHPIPLWVKISPDLATEQYIALLHAFAESGVKAVVATNTLPYPAPDNPELTAGVGGGQLHAQTIKVIGLLIMERVRHKYDIDVIGCGGVYDGKTYQNFKTWGIEVVQYWSALIYRGPLAAAMIINEA